MPEKDESKKPKYETPIVVPLGEMAKGKGDCGVGSLNQPGCGVGAIADICSDGGAAGFCSNGTVG
ncbi:MAG: hypothetical protein WC899_00850 [bacterium]|jgi:hypothetical protein